MGLLNIDRAAKNCPREVGEHTLTFDNLPAALVDQSLQASGNGVPAATILDVSAQNIFAESTSNAD